MKFLNSVYLLTSTDLTQVQLLEKELKEMGINYTVDVVCSKAGNDDIECALTEDEIYHVCDRLSDEYSRYVVKISRKDLTRYKIAKESVRD